MSLIHDGIRILMKCMDLDLKNTKLMVAAGKTPRRFLITFLERMQDISDREFDRMIGESDGEMN